MTLGWPFFFVLEYSCPRSHQPTEPRSDGQASRMAVLVPVRRVGEGEWGLHWPPPHQLLPTAPGRATAGDAGKNQPQICRCSVCSRGGMLRHQSQPCGFQRSRAGLSALNQPPARSPAEQPDFITPCRRAWAGAHGTETARSALGLGSVPSSAAGGHGTAWHGTAWHGMARHGTAWRFWGQLRLWRQAGAAVGVCLPPAPRTLPSPARRRPRSLLCHG